MVMDTSGVAVTNPNQIVRTSYRPFLNSLERRYDEDLSSG
jgi:hypothetical protein